MSTPTMTTLLDGPDLDTSEAQLNTTQDPNFSETNQNFDHVDPAMDVVSGSSRLHDLFAQYDAARGAHKAKVEDRKDISQDETGVLAQMGQDAWTADGSNGIIPVDVRNYGRHGYGTGRDRFDVEI